MAKGLTCDEVIDLALQLPETKEEAGARGLSVSRGGRGMIWMIEPTAKKLEGYQIKNADGCIFAFHVTWEAHDNMLAEPGSVFWKKPHYNGYPALLVDSSDLDEESGRRMIQAAWEAAPQKIKRRLG